MDNGTLTNINQPNHISRFRITFTLTTTVLRPFKYNLNVFHNFLSYKTESKVTLKQLHTTDVDLKEAPPFRFTRLEVRQRNIMRWYQLDKVCHPLLVSNSMTFRL